MKAFAEDIAKRLEEGNPNLVVLNKIKTMWTL